MGWALRWYQEEAINATYDFLRKGDGNPVVVLPTGSGKTPVLSTICQDAVNKWNGRVCVLAHVKELLQQSADHLSEVLPSRKIGIYSAGLNSRETDKSVIVAGIQSVYKRAAELGPFNLIIVDEAHLIPRDSDTMYRKFIETALIVNPKARVIGLTATPYRLDSGLIYGEDGAILSEIAYEVGVKDLIAQGFLCPIRTKRGKVHADMTQCHIRMGEFKADEMADAFDWILDAAVAEVIELTKDRKSTLVFTANCAHGVRVKDRLLEAGRGVGYVDANTSKGERADALAAFKDGHIQYMVNVNVLTTGFDATNIDAIAILRATLSPGLYYQMVGRGLRVNDNKADCLVLDYGDNALRHGPIDMIQVARKSKGGKGKAPSKECPECQEVIATGFAACPHCGFIFPQVTPGHNAEAGTADIVSGDPIETAYVVDRTSFFVHKKQGATDDVPRSMRVEYQSGSFTGETFREWICFEHQGFAREKAVNWWKARSNAPVPDSAADAVRLANAGAIATTRRIVVRVTPGEKYDRIVSHEIDDLPYWEGEESDEDFYGAGVGVDPLEDEIPF